MSHRFEYFPGNNMWSEGMMYAIEMAPWGAAALGEIDQVGQKLRDFVGDNERWWREWTAMAQRMEAFGESAERKGYQLTAGSYFLRAANYYFCGERFIPPSNRKLESYVSCQRCFKKGIERRYPQIERATVPYEGTTLPAWFHKADMRGAAPAVILFDGLDNAKEMSVLFGGLEIGRRGIHTLAIDGPGQGEALRLQGIVSRFDYEVPARAAYDYLSSRADVDPQRIAVMGFSMGGYYAPRAAAMEPRFAACVAWGGHFDYHDAWQQRWRTIQSSNTKLGIQPFQLPWVLGMPDMEKSLKKLENYRLSGVAEKITCPFYCIHGELDNTVPVEYAQRLYAAVGARDKTLRIISPYEGGSDHCQEDNRQIGANHIADWLAERLCGKLST